MWNYMKNFVIAFCSESSVHGVKYLIKDKNIVSRCYWCIVLIFSLYCCGEFSVLLWNHFLEIPIRMIVRTNQALTEELPLPSVTFCSEKPSDELYERFLEEIKLPPDCNRAEVLEAMILGVGELTPRFVPGRKALNATLMDMIDRVLNFNNITTRSFVERVSVPCGVLLSRCELRGSILPCEDLFQRVNGQCCRFIDDPDTYVSSGNLFSNNLKVVTTMDYGEAYLMIHRPLSESFVDQGSHTMNNGYYIVFYIDPIVVLKSEEVHEMEERSGACAHADEEELRFFDVYDFVNCAIEVMINQSIVLCGCAASYTPVPDEFTCNFTQLNCIRNYSALNKRPTGIPIFKNMTYLAASKGITLKSCSEACTYITYKRSYKPRVLVPEHDFTGFLSGVDPSSHYVMHFTYQSQFYRMEEFVLIADWITLLSNLGGVYGVFLGCSMLTLAELAYYLWSRVISKFCCTNRVSSQRHTR